MDRIGCPAGSAAGQEHMLHDNDALDRAWARLAPGFAEEEALVESHVAEREAAAGAGAAA